MADITDRFAKRPFGFNPPRIKLPLKDDFGIRRDLKVNLSALHEFDGFPGNPSRYVKLVDAMGEVCHGDIAYIGTPSDDHRRLKRNASFTALIPMDGQPL